MAETIVELLTDVADAIREKKGSNEPINAQNFADEIKNLPSGGGEEGGLNIGGEVFDETIWAITNIKEIRFKEGVQNISEALKNFTNIESLFLSSTISKITLGITTSCINLSTIEVDKNNTIYDSRDSCNAVMVTATNRLVAGCKNTIIPIGTTAIGYGAFQQITTLTDVLIPEGVKTIEAYAFYGCHGLTKMEFPSSVTSMQIVSFAQCSSIKLYDFSKHTSIPNLGNVSAFSGIATDCKIVVPDALYDEWIAATNWATYADKIVKSSEYTE